MSKYPRLRYWLIIAIFSAISIGLYVADSAVIVPARLHDILQAVAEALVVAIVVSLAVEPRLLRYFGEEIASQTFWGSFFSRAPQAYRDAIKGLASASRFAIATHWLVSLDWADDQRSVLKLSLEYTNHIENRSSKPHPVRSRYFVYESRFSGLTSTFTSYTLTCPDAGAAINLLGAGLIKPESSPDGRLATWSASNPDHPYFHVPAGTRYSMQTSAVTYVDTTDHFPIVVAVPTLSCTVQFEGDALSDLCIGIINPSSGTVRPCVEGSGDELKKKGRIQIGDVFITGQAILLSWKRISTGQEDTSGVRAETVHASTAPHHRDST